MIRKRIITPHPIWSLPLTGSVYLGVSYPKLLVFWKELFMKRIRIETSASVIDPAVKWFNWYPYGNEVFIWHEIIDVLLTGSWTQTRLKILDCKYHYPRTISRFRRGGACTRQRRDSAVRRWFSWWFRPRESLKVQPRRLTANSRGWCRLISWMRIFSSTSPRRRNRKAPTDTQSRGYPESRWVSTKPHIFQCQKFKALQKFRKERVSWNYSVFSTIVRLYLDYTFFKTDLLKRL